MKRSIRYYTLRVTPHFLITFLALALLTMTAFAQKPTLSINRIEGNEGKITIHYTTTDPLGAKLVTTNWQYSTDGRRTWQNIDAAAIGENTLNPPGRYTLTWDTTAGTNNLADENYPSVQFRMQVADMGRWQTVILLPGPGGPAIAGVGENIYVIGEHTVSAYTPQTDSWEELLADIIFPKPRAAAVANEKIYAVGGHPDYTFGAYDPQTNTWQPLAKLPTHPTPRDFFSVASVNGKIYAIGGWGINEWGQLYNLVSTVEEYDTQTNTWRRVAEMPTARAHLAAVAVGEKIYAIGGWDGGQRLATVEAYDPQKDRWESVADMPTPRTGLAATAVDGKIYAFGGTVPAFTGVGGVRYRKSALVEEYAPKINSWRAVNNMPAAREDITVAVVDGKIYIDGSDGEFTPPRHSDWALSRIFAIANRDYTVSVSVASSSLFADGSSTSQVTVTITDEDATPITDETVTLSTTLGTITPKALHSGNGIYIGTFTAGIKAGTATITATASNGKFGTATITLEQQVISPTHSTLLIDKKQAVADGVDEVTTTVHVKDTLDKPVPEQPVTITITGTGNTITPQKVNTNANGIATATISSTKAEIKTVTATVSNPPITLKNSVELQFVPGPVAKVSITAQPTTVLTDGESKSELIITVRDATDNPIPSKQPQIRQISPDLGKVSQITNNGDGTYTATYTAPQQINDQTELTLTVLVDDKSDSVSLTIRNTEIIITDISPESIKFGERVTVTGEMYPKIAIQITLTLKLGDASATESTNTELTNTDANGKINHTFSLNGAGDWQLIAHWEGDAKHKQVQSEPKNVTVKKAETEITLQPPDNLFSLTVGDTVSISGQITPSPGIANLSIVITNPDGNEETKQIQTDDSGKCQYQFTAEMAGNWRIQVSFSGDDDYLASQATLDPLPIGTELGRAIIVAGGRYRVENNLLWDITRKLCNDTYKTLQERRYSRQMIHYLSPAPFEDVDGDGRDDVGGQSTVEELKKAITELPVAFFKRNPNAQLFLYITGHGGENEFQLEDEREIVTADQINQWLDSLQRQTGLKKIVVIIDGSKSGSFIDNLSSEGRTIITSADASNRVFFGTDGSESFSHYFFQHIALGHSLAESFQRAEEASRPLMKYGVQHQIDSDGDGRANSDKDRALADQLFIGLDIKPGTTIPVIDQVIPPQEIKDTNIAHIWAEVSTVQGVQEFWAVIIPPNYQPPANDDGSSRLEFPVVSLTPSEEEKRYEGSYDNFVKQGEYTVIFYAEDRVGNVSIPKQTTVTVLNNRLVDTKGNVLTTWCKIKTSLLPNYPNPFNPETWIPYLLAEPIAVTLQIYDINGRPVRALRLGQKPAGEYIQKGEAAYWDGKDNTGEPVASGVYFCTLKAGNFAATRKMLLVK